MLEDSEIAILIELLRRKCRPLLNNMSFRHMTVDKATKFFNDVSQIPSKKRLEENIKFVFKLIFKILRKRLAQQYKLKNEKKLHALFYQEYF